MSMKSLELKQEESLHNLISPLFPLKIMNHKQILLYLAGAEQGSRRFPGIKFHDFSMIFHDSFPSLEKAFFIFQIFHDFLGRWEP